MMDEVDGDSSGHSAECISNEMLLTTKNKAVADIPRSSSTSSHVTDSIKYNSHLIARGASWTGDLRDSDHFDPVKGFYSGSRSFTNCVLPAAICQPSLAGKQKRSMSRSLPQNVMVPTEETHFLKENDYRDRLSSNKNYCYGNNNCVELVADPWPHSQNGDEPEKQQCSDTDFHLQSDHQFRSSITESMPPEHESVVQQCSDANDHDSCCQETLPWPAAAAYDYSSKLLHHPNELFHNPEIQDLKDANYRQSQFIEKLVSEKGQLEAAVREQAQLIMSYDSQNTFNRPTHREAMQSDFNCSIDVQVYETQLALYKEDFENERKEKLLLQSSANSLKEQLKTVLIELNLVKEKLKRTEDDLERHKDPFKMSLYQHNVGRISRQATSNTEQFAATSGEAKMSLYRKPNGLEPDRTTALITKSVRPEQVQWNRPQQFFGDKESTELQAWKTSDKVVQTLQFKWHNIF